MPVKKNTKPIQKNMIELRYYDLPEHEPVLALQGEEWVHTYGTEIEDLHFHNLMEIGLCCWGEGQMQLDDKRSDYYAGTVTFIPANILHTTLSRNGSLNEWAYLFFDPKPILQKSFPNDPPFVESVIHRLTSTANCLTGKTGAPLANLVRLVLSEYKEDRPYHAETVQHLMTALLLLATRFTSEEKDLVQHRGTGLQQIIPALEYINQNYMNSITVDAMAEQCSLSEAHLRRKFQEYLRMSPVDYLTSVRIRRGCELLNTTSCPVPEISLRVGYQSTSSFTRNFQRLMRISPYQYKKARKDYEGKLMDYKITPKKGWHTLEDDVEEEG